MTFLSCSSARRPEAHEAHSGEALAVSPPAGPCITQGEADDDEVTRAIQLMAESLREEAHEAEESIDGSSMSTPIVTPVDLLATSSRQSPVRQGVAFVSEDDAPRPSRGPERADHDAAWYDDSVRTLSPSRPEKRSLPITERDQVPPSNHASAVAGIPRAPTETPLTREQVERALPAHEEKMLQLLQTAHSETVLHQRVLETHAQHDVCEAQVRARSLADAAIREALHSAGLV